MNKTDFVRANIHRSTAEIIRMARAQHGETMSAAHVYTIRSRLKKAKGATGGKVAARVVSPKPKPSSSLRAEVDRISAAFVDRVLEALRQTSVREISEMVR